MGTSLDSLESRELMSNTLGAAELLNPPPAVVSAPVNSPRPPQAPGGMDLDEMWTYRRWKRQQPPANPPAQGPTNPPAQPPATPPKQNPANPAQPPPGTPADKPTDPPAPVGGQESSTKPAAGEPKPTESKPPEPVVAIDPASPKPETNGKSPTAKPVDPKNGETDTGPLATDPNKAPGENPKPTANLEAPTAAPVALLRPLVDFEVKEGTLILQNVSSLDPGAPQGVKYSLEGAVPAGATIDPNTGKINWMPKDGPSAHQLTIKAVAPDGRVETKTIKATIANEIPTTWLGPDLTLAPGVSLNRTIIVSDPGDDAITLTIDYGDGKQAQVVALGSARSYQLDHAYAKAGDFTVTVTALDSDGAQTNARLGVRVSQPQTPNPGNPNPGNPNPGNPNPGNPNPGNPNPGNPNPGNPNPGNPNPGNPNPGNPNPGNPNPNPGNPNPNPGNPNPNPGKPNPNPGNPNPGNPNPNPGNGNPPLTVVPTRIKGMQYQPARGFQRAKITITFDKKISPNLAGFEVRDSLGQIIPVKMSSNSRGAGGTVVTLMPYNNKTSLTKNGAPQVKVLGDQLVDTNGVRVDANGDGIPGGTYAQVVTISRRPPGRR